MSHEFEVEEGKQQAAFRFDCSAACRGAIARGETTRAEQVAVVARMAVVVARTAAARYHEREIRCRCGSRLDDAFKSALALFMFVLLLLFLVFMALVLVMLVFSLLVLLSRIVAVVGVSAALGGGLRALNALVAFVHFHVPNDVSPRCSCSTTHLSKNDGRWKGTLQLCVLCCFYGSEAPRRAPSTGQRETAKSLQSISLHPPNACLCSASADRPRTPCRPYPCRRSP